MSSTNLLEMRGISKSFSSVRVLNNVSLTLRRGEVLALLGENGAGKSTLMKILCGIHRPTAGDVLINGEPLKSGNAQAAQRAGVSVIHQEFNLIQELSVRENLFLGHESSLFKKLPVTQEKERAQAVFKRLRTELNTEVCCGSLTVAQQQLVEIGKALLLDSKLIVMDEPTAALSPQEVEGLFNVIRELKSQNISVVYISHRLNEIFTICDRITVLRDGELVGTHKTSDLTRNQLIEMMVGRSLDQEFPKRTANAGGTLLEARNLNRGRKVQNVSLTLRKGEIVALTGLIGAGRTEVARLLFGADQKESGTMTLNGQPVQISNPRQAIKAGVCLLTEDRKAQGLIVNQSVLHNFGLPNLKKFSTKRGIDHRQEQTAFESYQQSMQIKLASPDQAAKTLSGGNQQKVVLAKWLERNSEVIIFDEPTRGIDVGAKYEIYQLMNQLAAKGKAILMITSELPEALGMADRILVMHEGRLTGEITDVESAKQEQIMDLAV